MPRKQFTFYRSFWDAIQEQPSKIKAELILAICAYALDDEEPKGLSPNAAMGFRLIRPVLDTGKRKSENGKKGGETKQNESKTKANDKQTATEIEKEIEKELEKEIEIEIEYESINKATKPPRVCFGEYGWVKLTEEQYQKLVAEFGQAEVDRCIRYIDESAQSNGNKNKWKDWDLVIRKCHREGWGVTGAYGKKTKPVTISQYPTAPDPEETARLRRFIESTKGEE